MGKKKKETQEQLDLIDVAPENAKPIIAAARVYKKAQKARLSALKNEIDQKQKVLALIKEAEIKPGEGGKIVFKYDNVLISVTPRDELVRITEPKPKE